MSGEGVADGLAGGQVPDADSPVTTFGDGDGFPVQDRARHRGDIYTVCYEGLAEGWSEVASGGPGGRPLIAACMAGELTKHRGSTGAGSVESKGLSAYGGGGGGVQVESSAVDGGGEACFV